MKDAESGMIVINRGPEMKDPAQKARRGRPENGLLPPRRLSPKPNLGREDGSLLS